MNTAIIIAEYNPFHNGHAYQIEKVRERFGSDTAVIVLMSGVYTQRGDVAVASPYVRAHMAIEGGVNLVLSLPFPFSSLSAERYAASAVSLAMRVCPEAVLCFGAECPDAGYLAELAKRLDSYGFQDRLSAVKKENPKCSYPQWMELALENDEKAITVIRKPNNILALSYLRAIHRLGATLTTFVIARTVGYHDEVPHGDTASASAVRSMLYRREVDSALHYIPKKSSFALLDAIENGKCPTSFDPLYPYALARLEASYPTSPLVSCDASLYAHLAACARDASDYMSCIARATPRHLPAAAVKRAFLASVFGITEEYISAAPAYTQVYAADEVGTSVLREMKVNDRIPLLTKPADFILLPPQARRQAEYAFHAESLISLAYPKAESLSSWYKKTPYIKKPHR